MFLKKAHFTLTLNSNTELLTHELRQYYIIMIDILINTHVFGIIGHCRRHAALLMSGFLNLLFLLQTAKFYCTYYVIVGRFHIRSRSSLPCEKKKR